MTTSKARRKAKGRYVVGYDTHHSQCVYGKDNFEKEPGESEWRGIADPMPLSKALRYVKKLPCKNAAIFRLVRVRRGGKS